VEPNSRFTLVYGNRSVDTIIFSEALEDLKNQYLSRFTLYHVLSRQPQEVDLLHGRLDRERVADSCKHCFRSTISTPRSSAAPRR
jgi:ring-1,2-phenylacetyl-CoA epoxidase subunit PaaE